MINLGRSEPESSDALELVSNQSDGLVDAHAIDIDADPRGKPTLARSQADRLAGRSNGTSSRSASLFTRVATMSNASAAIQNGPLLDGLDVTDVVHYEPGASCSANPRQTRGR